MIQRMDVPEERGAAFDERLQLTTIGRHASTEHDQKGGYSRKKEKAFDTVGRQVSTEHNPKDGHPRKKRGSIR